MSEPKYFVWLSAKGRLSAAAAYRAVRQLGTPEDIYNAGSAEIDRLNGIGKAAKELLKDKSMVSAEQIIEKCIRKNISIVTFSDANYPERLRNIPNPPLALYIKGQLGEIDNEMAVAFVGHRSAAPKMLEYVKRLAADFAGAGGLVVSGMAKGIDGAAHRGAMAVGKPTIAVLGCGVDRCYPDENRDVYNYASENGALVSEYPPGTPPIKYNFPERNRILSGMSLGVLVAEAPCKSGSLITAKYAAEQSRDVFVIPGSPAEACCAGSNRLLKDGAKPVTDAMDIIEEYIGIYPEVVMNRTDYCRQLFHTARTPDDDCTERCVENNRESAAEKRTRAEEKDEVCAIPEGLSDNEAAVLRAVEHTAIHIDAVINKTGFPPETVLSALTTLEIWGLVSQLPGKFFIRA